MNVNFKDSRLELICRLSVAARRSRRRQVFRLITQPRKTLYAKLIRITKIMSGVKARTFWGGAMNVVLPEIVSTHIWKYGYFEEDVCIYMLRFLKEEMTFLDIGAHFGFFTLLGSYLVGERGRVLSFEPIPTTYEQLQLNSTKYCVNHNIETYNCAAYSENAELEFYDYGQEHSAYNSAFGLRNSGAASIMNNAISVKARKIDDLLQSKNIKNVDLIKIDAESSEIHVLKGMLEAIINFRPKIIIEVGDFSISGVPKSKEIVLWLQQRNYLPFEVQNGEIVPHNGREEYESGNLLFVAS